MPAYPLCTHCMVCKGIEVQVNEYKAFRSAVKCNVLKGLPDHARGFVSGQLSVLAEVISDLTRLRVYLEIERARREEGKRD